MKYCVKCGHEMVDDAVVCTGCGRMVSPIVEEKKEEPKDNNGRAKVIGTFHLVFSILFALSVFAGLLAAACGSVDTSNYYYGYKIKE